VASFSLYWQQSGPLRPCTVGNRSSPP